jgi:hypothetical protein
VSACRCPPSARANPPPAVGTGAARALSITRASLELERSCDGVQIRRLARAPSRADRSLAPASTRRRDSDRVAVGRRQRMAADARRATAAVGRLQLDLAPAEAKKAQGARLFKLGDWTGADDAYAEAIAALPADAGNWPAAESLLIVLRANRAMCLLKAGHPETAVEQCEEGLALPGVSMETGMQAKLLARKMEALLACDPPHSDEAAAVYCEARNLGLLSGAMKGKGTKALLAKFDDLAARLPAPVPAEPKAERTAPLKELISMLLSCQKHMPAEEGDMIVEIFETMLNGEGAMEPRHVCALDPVGKGTLMWALGCGFSKEPTGTLRSPTHFLIQN